MAEKTRFDNIDIEVPANQTYQFIIPPKVTHAIKNIGEKVNIRIASIRFPIIHKIQML